MKKFKYMQLAKWIYSSNATSKVQFISQSSGSEYMSHKNRDALK